MIKTIFFDFDGVLTTDFNGSGNVASNLCAQFPSLNNKQTLECYKKHFSHLQIHPGSFQDKLPSFCQCLNLEIKLTDMMSAISKVTINKKMVRLAQNLKNRYNVGILTDNPKERIELIDKKYHLSQTFHPIIISANAGASKHEGTTTIFDTALQETQSKPEELFFIDNQKRNLVTPQKMGIHTYWHDDKKNDIEALKKTLQGLISL